jgi:hypothetical protein
MGLQKRLVEKMSDRVWLRGQFLFFFAVLLPLTAQQAQIRPAPAIEIPFQVDGNSPSFWRDGRFHFMTSTGHPVIASGPRQLRFWSASAVSVIRSESLPMWIESAWVDGDGTVYGWYHHEPAGLCRGTDLTAPRIGAVVSYDGGLSFFDLGLILTSGDPVDCTAKNGFFAGGHGDFSVILNRERTHFYFFFTNYGGAPARQGVAAARLAFEHRSVPVGAVYKYADGAWSEPGLGGRVTPVFPARVSWMRPDADSFWGPAIHWNKELERYVMLLNHACCEPRWPQDGIYVTFSSDLTQPINWTRPVRILDEIGFAPGFYPQVLGLGLGESDTLAGRRARLFIHGKSRWEIIFRKLAPEHPAEIDEIPEYPVEERPLRQLAR